MERRTQDLFVTGNSMARGCLFGLMVLNTLEGMRTGTGRDQASTLTQRIAAILRVAGAMAL
jgi:hypothetical protein